MLIFQILERKQVLGTFLCIFQRSRLSILCLFKSECLLKWQQWKLLVQKRPLFFVFKFFFHYNRRNQVLLDPKSPIAQMNQNKQPQQCQSDAIGQRSRKNSIGDVAKKEQFLPGINARKSSITVHSTSGHRRQSLLAKKLLIGATQVDGKKQKQNKSRINSQHQKETSDKIKRIGKLSPLKAIKIEVEQQPIAGKYAPSKTEVLAEPMSMAYREESLPETEYIINVKSVNFSISEQYKIQQKNDVNLNEQIISEQMGSYRVVINTVTEREVIQQQQQIKAKCKPEEMPISFQQTKKEEKDKHLQEQLKVPLKKEQTKGGRKRPMRSFDGTTNKKKSSKINKEQCASSSNLFVPSDKLNNFQDKIDSSRTLLSVENKQVLHSSRSSSHKIQYNQRPHKIFKTHPFLNNSNKKPQRKSHVVQKKSQAALKKLSNSKLVINQKDLIKLLVKTIVKDDGKADLNNNSSV